MLLALLFTVLACEKDSTKTNSRDEILAGNYGKMLVNRMDTMLIGGYNQQAIFNLDLDGDGTPDFRLTSEYWGSPGMEQHPRAQILSLSTNSLINGNLINDTIFYNYSSYNQSCYYFPTDQIRYIGVKLTDGDKERIGWIKLGLFDEYKLMIFETALWK